MVFLGLYTSSLLVIWAEDEPIACDAVPGQPSCVCKTKNGFINLSSLAFANSTPA